jgi:hypothetical protein
VVLVELVAEETVHSVFLRVRQVQYLSQVEQTLVVAVVDTVAVAMVALVAAAL